MPCKTKPYCPVYFKKECRQIQNTKFNSPFISYSIRREQCSYANLMWLKMYSYLNQVLIKRQRMHLKGLGLPCQKSQNFFSGPLVLESAEISIKSEILSHFSTFYLKKVI